MKEDLDSTDIMHAIKKIRKEFGSQIISETTSNNEIYFSVKKDAAVDICDYIYNNLGAQLAMMFATDQRIENDVFVLRYVFSMDESDTFIIVQINIEADTKKPQFQSITHKIPASNLYEREIQDMFGLIAKEHPDPRRLVMFEDWPHEQYPLRKDFDLISKFPRAKDTYEYKKVEGEGVCEVLVGPVHAGVIEPGHFRFSVAGELVTNLEIRHFYTHKGIEKLFENLSVDKAVFLAERVSGDNSVAHVVAFCQAIEKLACIDIPLRAKYIRTILLELERLYNHVSDIGGIATDAGFYMGSAHGSVLKEKLMQLNEKITGSRLLRGMVTPGGVRRDIKNISVITAEFASFEHEFKDLINLLLDSPSLVDRIETTGYLNHDIAKALNVVGPIGRASGIDKDIRRDHPYAAYSSLDFDVSVQDGGDVYARTIVRSDEVLQCFSIIHQALRSIEQPVSTPIKIDIGKIPTGHSLGYAEAPRGEILYWVMIVDGKIERCKVRDPSFCNWLAIEYAVLDNIIPDFPLINKSLSLSYSGNDN